ncbi:FxSxx-COOH cyclophane-containing RiPP peptide [Streptomyces sp. NPDC051940]|uniref:FxSxx-COOH cyclophane-containing RiPP peptide n=1 Tax=Streptomyces sp. NPDC051940 TaxID=3155675 RepID=UPI00342A35A5
MADIPDLTGVPLEEILDGTSPALSAALRRVLSHLAGEEAPVAAYDSGGDPNEGPRRGDGAAFTRAGPPDPGHRAAAS